MPNRQPTVTEEFVDLCDASEIEEGEIRGFELANAHVCVTRVGDRFFAFDENCTHRRCSLLEGDLDEHVLICACHGAEFDIRDGDVLLGPAVDPLPVYELRVQDGRLQMREP